jgi:hypothetical protein
MQREKRTFDFNLVAFSRLSRMFSALTRESSICSGVTTLVPWPFSVPAAAITQLRSVGSVSPSSLAKAPTLWPAFTRFTDSSLNSGVYSCFGIFLNFASPSNLPGRYTPSLGRRNFGGSSLLHQVALTRRKIISIQYWKGRI